MQQKQRHIHIELGATVGVQNYGFFKTSLSDDAHVEATEYDAKYKEMYDRLGARLEAWVTFVKNYGHPPDYDETTKMVATIATQRAEKAQKR